MTRMLCRRAASILDSPPIIGPQSEARVNARWMDTFVSRMESFLSIWYPPERPENFRAAPLPIPGNPRRRRPLPGPGRSGRWADEEAGRLHARAQRGGG